MLWAGRERTGRDTVLQEGEKCSETAGYKLMYEDCSHQLEDTVEEKTPCTPATHDRISKINLGNLGRRKMTKHSPEGLRSRYQHMRFTMFLKQE